MQIGSHINTNTHKIVHNAGEYVSLQYILHLSTHTHVYLCTYRKLQILRGTKLSQFTGFLQTVGKTVAVLLNYNTYFFEQAIEISRENFRVLSKIHENRKSFVLRGICCLRYTLLHNYTQNPETAHIHTYIHIYNTCKHTFIHIHVLTNM